MCKRNYYMTPEFTCRKDTEWDVVTPPVEEILPDIYIVNENRELILGTVLIALLKLLFVRE